MFYSLEYTAVDVVMSFRWKTTSFSSKLFNNKRTFLENKFSTI